VNNSNLIVKKSEKSSQKIEQHNKESHEEAGSRGRENRCEEQKSVIINDKPAEESKEIVIDIELEEDNIQDKSNDIIMGNEKQKDYNKNEESIKEIESKKEASVKHLDKSLNKSAKMTGKHDESEIKSLNKSKLGLDKSNLISEKGERKNAQKLN